MTSLQLPKNAGAQLFKEGYQQMKGIDEAIIRNIHAVHDLANIVRTSYGCHGRNKIVVNHLQKLFLTNDAATIIRELDVIHPAAKLIIMASQQQEQEMGDGTNFVIMFGGELLSKAETLLRIGIHPSDVIRGYEMAAAETLRIIEDLTVDKVADTSSKPELAKAIQTSIASKQYGNEKFLGELVAEAVLAVLPNNPKSFNVDNVRVVKVLGGGLGDSAVVKGMVFARTPEGTITRISGKAKVAVFSCPIDISQTETKGTVLLKNAKEMLDFTKGEEAQMEQAIKELADSGVRVAVSGSAIGELALHYLNRFNILALKVLSKFDIRRLCRVVGATPLARLGAPMPEEMGTVDIVETIEIGGDRVTVFRQEKEVTKTATIVLRGATQNHLDDVERAVDDGVNVVKALTKDARLLAGAGAVEMEISKRIAAFGERTPGLLQYGIQKYAEAFEVVPRTLAENAGMDANEIVNRLHAGHYNREDGLMGLDIEVRL